jgi:GDPmannose 4,6-dehydratase
MLELGNLEASRDWGWAPEFVEAMWCMLQQSQADDYVLATGSATTVRDFARAAFDEAGIPLEFEGTEDQEIARHAKTGQTLVKVNPRFYRAADPVGLVGNPAHAARVLGWRPQVSGAAVAREMVKCEKQKVES